MDKFWIVTLFHLQPSQEELSSIENRAMDQLGALGIEEFTMDEPEVDALLGERSYSGGDLPETVLDEVEASVMNRPSNYRFFFGDKDLAREFLKMTQVEYLCEAQIEEAVSEDWNAEWKKHYSPIRVNDKLEIIPAWMKDYSSTSAHKIFINPGMGFGTGSHETTYLCLKLYTEKVLGNATDTVLDFGSGSGILGLATLLFAPEAKVDFYDIDPEANKNCFQNAEINQLDKCQFRLLLPEVRERLHPQYNLVFANILENILILEKENLVSFLAPNASLILSGLLKPQLDGIISAYSKLGLKLVERVEKGDWGALLFSRGNA